MENFSSKGRKVITNAAVRSKIRKFKILFFFHLNPSFHLKKMKVCLLTKTGSICSVAKARKTTMSRDSVNFLNACLQIEVLKLENWILLTGNNMVL